MQQVTGNMAQGLWGWLVSIRFCEAALEEAIRQVVVLMKQNDAEDNMGRWDTFLDMVQHFIRNELRQMEEVSADRLS
jgi:hypothetical protein